VLKARRSDLEMKSPEEDGHEKDNDDQPKGSSILKTALLQLLSPIFDYNKVRG
jgi:hypothetical protein